MIWGRSSAVGVLACLVALVAGCDGDASSQPTPPPSNTSASGSPSRTGSPSSSASGTGASSPSSTSSSSAGGGPTVPAAARANTASGAEAFARFYLELVNTAWIEPNPDLLRPYVLATCKSCANQVATARDLKARGLSYDGPAARLGPSIVTPASDRSSTSVDVSYIQLRRNIVDHNGKVVDRLPRDTALFEVRVRWRVGSGWRVASITVVET